jgi:hypothetical protein
MGNGAEMVPGGHLGAEGSQGKKSTKKSFGFGLDLSLLRSISEPGGMFFEVLF